MRPHLAAVAARQSGLFTRSQARAADYSERELRTLTKPGGEWQVVRRGVYVARATWDAADVRGRHLLEVRAAVLNAREPWIVSHGSAAVLHGLPVLHVPRLVHLTRPGVNGGRAEHGVTYHPADVPSVDLFRVGGLAVTSPARTALDVAREEGYAAGLVVADQALRAGTSRAELTRVVTGMKWWPGVTRARPVVADADPGAESVGETLARSLVAELGFGRPQTQFPVTEGGRTAWADLRLGWHLVEFDGRVKYARDRPYDDSRPGEDVLWEEKRREDWLRSHGYGVSRVVWPELFGAAREKALLRLGREVGATLVRVGEQEWLRSLAETEAAIFRGGVDASRAS